MASQLTLDGKAVILQLVGKKMPLTEISKKNKKSQPCITKFLQKYRRTKTIHRKKESGRPSKLSKRDKARIIRETIKNRRSSLRKIKKNIDLKVTHQTIGNVLKDHNLKQDMLQISHC